MPQGEVHDSYAGAIIAQLFQTQNLIQTLLSEIKENSNSHIALSYELKNLQSNVENLSHIIKGDDGGKSLIVDVEVLKANFAKLEESVFSLLDSCKKEIDLKIEHAEKKRSEEEIAKLQIEAAKESDIRLDGRTRLNTWSTIIIAVISLIGSLAALLVR